MEYAGNIATLVDESADAKADTADMVILRCAECDGKVAVPITDYNAMKGDKDWKGAWIRYTPQEMASRYSKEELQMIESMSEHERDFYIFKILTKENAYCNLKCNCFFTDD